MKDSNEFDDKQSSLPQIENDNKCSDNNYPNPASNDILEHNKLIF